MFLDIACARVPTDILFVISLARCYEVLSVSGVVFQLELDTCVTGNDHLFLSMISISYSCSGPSTTDEFALMVNT